MAANKKNKLTPKQKMFVKEYLVDLNATQAAIRAGYSEKTAMEQGYQLLHNTTVQKAIQEAMAKRSKRTEVSADKVLEQLARIAFADLGEFVEFKGNTIVIKPIEEVDGTVLSEVAETQNGLKVKLNDKMKALELIGRHLGMFNDKLNIDMKNHNLEPTDGVNSLKELINQKRQGKDEAQPDTDNQEDNKPAGDEQSPAD